MNSLIREGRRRRHALTHTGMSVMHHTVRVNMLSSDFINTATGQTHDVISLHDYA